MPQEAPKSQGRFISVEAAICLVVALVNLALDQADIHIMSISWLSVLGCIALCVDMLRRTKWVKHPDHGKKRLAAGSSVIFVFFMAFGVFLSLHKKAVADTEIETAATHVMPAPGPPPATENSTTVAELPTKLNTRLPKKPAPKQIAQPRAVDTSVLPARTVATSSQLEAGTSKTDKTRNPCPPAFELGPTASDTTIVHNTTQPCIPIIKSNGQRVLVANNLVVDSPPAPPSVVNNAPGGIANSGTIGIATVVHNGLLERHLSQRQRDALKAFAASLPNSMAEWLSVMSTRDDESQAYAKELTDALADPIDSKKRPDLIVDLGGTNAEFTGVHVIIISDADEHFAYAKGLAIALNSREAPVNFHSATGLKPGQVKAFICRAPTTPPVQEIGK